MRSQQFGHSTLIEAGPHHQPLLGKRLDCRLVPSGLAARGRRSLARSVRCMLGTSGATLDGTRAVLPRGVK